MKKNILTGLFLLITLHSISQITTMAKTPRQPAVTILKTEPEQLIEGGRIIVYFRFNNPNGTLLNGWIGADVNSGTSAPGKSIIDWPVIDLGMGQSVDGAIMVNTTDAGVGKKLRVFFYETQEKRSDNSLLKSDPLYTLGEKDVNIAALVNFKLTSFTINHTRARSTDTDWGSLYAVVDDVPVMDPASIYIGNFQDGTYPFKGTDAENKMIEKMETGPVALVPGLNSSLYIAYTMYNGGGIADSKSFLRGYAQATANPVMFHGERPGTNAAIEVFKKLNPFLNIIGGCDGFVVMDTLTIHTNGIFNNTNNGNGKFSKRYNSEEYASQTGCGNTSDYVVNSSIERLSNYIISNKFPPPVFTRINRNRTIALNEYLSQEVPSIYNVVWQKIETIEKDGNFAEKNDPGFGYLADQKYHSPTQVNEPRLVILRGSLVNKMGDIFEKNSLSVLNNGPLKQVTAIVQLIPGNNLVDKTHTTPIPNNNDAPGVNDEKEKRVPNKVYGDTVGTGPIMKKKNFETPVVLTGEWSFKITSSTGTVFTGKLNLVQDGTSITGNLLAGDHSKTRIAGSFVDNILNLRRDTGLETIQVYQLTKVNDSYFSGTYTNKGKYADSGTVEFFR